MGPKGCVWQFYLCIIKFKVLNPLELYFCHHCGTNVESPQDLFFIDDSSKCFCSEKCSELFFSKFVKYFEKIEKEKRSKFKISDEPILDLLTKKKYIDQVLFDPFNITFTENILGEKIYNYNRHVIHGGKKVFFLITCLVLEGKPTFVFSATASYNSEFVKSLNFSRHVEHVETFKQEKPLESMLVDRLGEDTLEEIEQKKSVLLAELLNKRKDSDIPFESFTNYLKFVEQTLEFPDEVYEWNDIDGDELLIFNKALSEGGVSFYLIIIAFQGVAPDEGKNIVVPILIFPTLDSELYSHYCTGNLVSGQLKN